MHETNSSPSGVSPEGDNQVEQKEINSESNIQNPYVNGMYGGGYMSYIPYQMPVQQMIPVQAGSVYPPQIAAPVTGYQYQAVAPAGYGLYGNTAPVQYYPQAFIQPFVSPYMGVSANVVPEKPAPSSVEAASEELPGNERLPKFDEHKYGQLMEVVNDFVNGTPPEMSKVMELMNGMDTQFMKGTVVGAIGAFAAGNETVRRAAVSMVAKVMNAFGTK